MKMRTSIKKRSHIRGNNKKLTTVNKFWPLYSQRPKTYDFMFVQIALLFFNLHKNIFYQV